MKISFSNIFFSLPHYRRSSVPVSPSAGVTFASAAVMKAKKANKKQIKTAPKKRDVNFGNSGGARVFANYNQSKSSLPNHRRYPVCVHHSFSGTVELSVYKLW